MPSISLAMCHSIDVEEKREDAAQTEQGHVEGPTNEEGEEQKKKKQKQKEERLNENDIVKTEVEPESTLLTGILPTTVTDKVEKEDFSFMKDSSSAKNSLSSQTKPAQPDEESAESCTEDAKAATPLDRFEQARSRLSELRGILAKHRLPVALRQLPDVSTSSSANRLLSPLTPSSPFTTFTTHEGDHTDDIQHVHGWSKEDDERLFHLLRTTHPHAIEDQEECRSLAKALGTKSHRQVTRRLRLLVQQGGVPPPSTSFPSLAGSPSPIGSPGVYQMGQNGRRMDAYTSAIMTAATGHSKGATRSKNSRVSGTFYTRQAFRVCQVTMPDSDGEGEDEKQLSMAFLQSLDDSVKQTSAYRELCDLMAKRKALRQKHNYRKRQQRRMAPVMSDVVHHGFKCDQCQVEPIVGVRYKCRQCPVEKEVDLCCTCFELGTFRNELHDQRHTFKPIETAEILMLDEEMREYAYLDPVSYKLSGFNDKYFLREMYVGPTTTRRNKLRLFCNEQHMLYLAQNLFYVGPRSSFLLNVKKYSQLKKTWN